jgi:hypothetical protein
MSATVVLAAWRPTLSADSTLFDPEPGQIWNQIYRSFHVHALGRKMKFADDDLDPVLWPNFKDSRRASLLPCGSAQRSSIEPPAWVAKRVREYRKANEHRIIEDLTDLLAIPNTTTDTKNIQRNATKLVEMLEQGGFHAQLLPMS